MIRVLHIDDAQNDNELVREFLSRIDKGIEVEWAHSADDALDQLKFNRYDCILCDFQMPGKDGLELLKSIRQRNIDTPFIFLTGQGNEKLAEQAFNYGANDYYTKNSGFALYDRLANSIKRVVESQRETTQRIRFENALSALVKDTSADTGVEYFESLIINLTNTVGVKYGFIAEKQKEYLSTVCFFADGEQKGNYSYEIKGSPCAEALEKGICYYPEHVQEYFPLACNLKELNIESFCGCRLNSRDGKPLGILVLMHDRKLNDRDFILSLVKIFATRASAEMERLNIQNALKESEELYRTIFNSVDDQIMIIDLEPPRILDVNQSTLDYTGFTFEEVLQLQPDTGLDEEHREKATREVVENMQRAAAGEVVSTSKAVQMKSGEWVMFDIRLIRVVQNGKIRIVSLARPTDKPPEF